MSTAGVSYLLLLHFLATMKMAQTKKGVRHQASVWSGGERLWMRVGQRTSSEDGSSAAGADYIDYMHPVRQTKLTAT